MSQNFKRHCKNKISGETTMKNILLWLMTAVIVYFLMLLYAIGATAWAWLPLMFTFYGKSFWLGFIIGIFVSHIAHIIYKAAN